MVNDVRFLASEWQVADDPNAGAAEELGRLLEQRGVDVGGDGVSGITPAEASTIASIESAELPLVIAEMQASSDNNTAEMLLREIGVATGGGGSSDAGAAAVLAALAELGHDTAGIVVDDASGLSNENRVTCRLLVDVLAQHRPGDEFSSGLPLAGDQSTTLRDNFIGSPVEGRLYGKTGTLHNEPYNADPPAVKALSGYVTVEGGGTIEYALILNSAGTLTEQTVYRPIWNEFARVLGTYPAGPTATALGPRQ
jgi:D-alanyl-D-alanine carboxypeptidase/D-alanyl-D-alanine-endopeptidase (penicillin-binding protein 4)